jgi:molecular chaperone HscB
MNEQSEPANAGVAPPEQIGACWSCKGPVSSRALFCHTCGIIQPPQAIDHFARLGVPVSFDIDPGQLERGYFGFQRIVHPDRFAAKSAREKALSQAQAVAVNDAWEILRDPLSRADYLLALRGAPLPGDDKTVNDPELLMTALEDRETLEEAKSAAEVDKVLLGAERGYDGAVVGLSRAFGADDLDKARKLTLKLRYLDKFRDEARAKRGRLDGKS